LQQIGSSDDLRSAATSSHRQCIDYSTLSAQTLDSIIWADARLQAELPVEALL
jgi:hypothetical protein